MSSTIIYYHERPVCPLSHICYNQSINQPTNQSGNDYFEFLIATLNIRREGKKGEKIKINLRLRLLRKLFLEKREGNFE